MPLSKTMDSLVDRKAVLALVVNSGFYRHQSLRKDLFTVFRKQGEVRDWNRLTSTDWDVLYLLIENHITGRKACITDIPYAVSLSTSTARRTLRKLERFGLAVTCRDTADKRRTISELSKVFRPVIDAFVANYSHGFAALIQQHDRQERLVAQQALERTREELMASEALLLQAQKLASLGNWVWDDINIRYIMASEEVARIHGITLKEFMDEGRVKYFDDGYIHPEDLERYRDTILEADKKCVGYDLYCRIITAGGEVRHIREISQPILNEHGQLVRSIGTTQDISDYVKVEQALRESELRYRRLLDQSHDLMAVFRPEGERVFVNKAYCKFTGKSEQELLKGKAGDAYSPRDYKKFRDSIRALTPENPTIERKYAMIRHDGEKQMLMWTDHGRFDGNGMLVEIHATGHIAPDDAPDYNG